MSTWQSGYTVNGMVIGATTAEPIKTQAGLLVTRAVETQAGWVGQIIIDKMIVWESDTYADDGSTEPINDGGGYTGGY